VADIGEPVLWNGQTHAAIIPSIESSEIVQIGGFAEDTISQARSLRVSHKTVNGPEWIANE
jgi:hypothetical protein